MPPSIYTAIAEQYNTNSHSKITRRKSRPSPSSANNEQIGCCSCTKALVFWKKLLKGNANIPRIILSEKNHFLIKVLF